MPSEVAHDYPEISHETLITIRMLRSKFLEDRDFVRHKECPYSANIKELLDNIFRTAEKDETNRESSYSSIFNQYSDKYEAIEREVLKLYNQIGTFEVNNAKPNDVTEMIHIFKMRAQLLEKMINTMEKATTLHQRHQFEQTMLQIMDQILDPDQRTRVMDLLRVTFSTEKDNNEQTEDT